PLINSHHILTKGDIPMSDPSTDLEAAYDTLLPTISAIPDSETVYSTIPIEEAVADAEKIGVLIKQDDEVLRKTGIDPKYLDSYSERLSAFVWSAAIIQQIKDTESTAAKEWEQRKPEGVEVRRILLRTFQYAFRNDPDLLKSIKKIIEGKGNRDFLLDLVSCSKLGKANIELLKKVNADLSLLDKADSLYPELSDIFARMVIDPENHKKNESIYNKAWTYLKEAMDEIYAAGRYAFDETNDRHQLYYSDYRKRLGMNSAKAAQEKKASEKEVPVSA
ncbi:MAG TPA: hypothetical protein VHO70_17150, partial [Chitinispirillaceae bacterium]|nr:hypothetical protein [Chitinispirillaceae bacterium]